MESRVSNLGFRVEGSRSIFVNLCEGRDRFVAVWASLGFHKNNIYVSSHIIIFCNSGGVTGLELSSNLSTLLCLLGSPPSLSLLSS